MCEFIKPENKDDINKIDKITEYVNVELGKCETYVKGTKYNYYFEINFFFCYKGITK